MKFWRASVLSDATYYWANASDFQQHFWCIAFFISNISIQSQISSGLGTLDIATCKWSTLLALKIFKGNKRHQVESNILGLSYQRTKGYVVEAVAQRCSAKKVEWNIWSYSYFRQFLVVLHLRHSNQLFDIYFFIIHFILIWFYSSSNAYKYIRLIYAK